MEFEHVACLDREDDDEHLWRIFLEKLNSASSKPSTIGLPTTIFRVPENIRRSNADSFEPKMVSVGPYHHGKQHFRATDERIKLPYARNFFRRTADGNLGLRMVKLFKEFESHLRGAYSEQIRMSSNEFAEMMMLDFAFTVEFLLGRAGLYRTATDVDHSWNWAAPSIVIDMLLLENQFPLSPLLYLLDVCSDALPHHGSSLRELLCHVLMPQIHGNLSPTSIFKSSSDVNCIERSTHLLHLFHSSLVQKLPIQVGHHLRTDDFSSFPSAEMLEAMRIQFTNKTNGSSFLDITFDESKRSMEIPQFVVNDDNISLLRNLIAFEQQCRWVDKCISGYVWFMDCLINTDKDVAVLRKHKIIVSRLRSDEEVAHMFNELRRDAPVVDFHRLFYLEEVMINVESYSRNWPNRFWALWNFSWLKQNYFKNRWVTIGVIGVVFFNLLTLVQTVYAVLSYAKQ